MPEPWREKGGWARLKVLELLFTKGMANRHVAALLKVSFYSGDSTISA
jgi:hypothetical protein